MLSTLALNRLRRYTLSGDERDLEISILQSTHAIFLPFPFSTKRGPNIVSTFFFLLEALLHRSRNLNQPNDVKYCVDHLHYLQGHRVEAFGITRNRVATLLVLALALQELESGNSTQRIQKMSVLCHELLSSALYEPDLNDAIASFARAVCTHINHSTNQPSQQIFDCLREANMRFPDLHVVSFALLQILSLRFSITKSNDDYENAIYFSDRIITSPSSYLTPALGLAAGLAGQRFIFHGNLEYLEEAIIRTRSHLESISPEDPQRRVITQTLIILERARSDDFGLTDGLSETNSDNQPLTNRPSFSNLVASLVDWNAANCHSVTTQDYFRHYYAIDLMDLITDKAEIEEAAKYCRLLLAYLLQRPDDAVTLTYLVMGKSAHFLLRAFDVTNNPLYLDESIDAYRAILRMPNATPLIDFTLIEGLFSSVSSRFQLSKNRKDFAEIIELSSIATTHAHGTVPDRFRYSCHWARTARTSGHPSTSTAYQSAISLMQDCLAFAPILEIQHFRLVAMRNQYETLPLDYASYLLHMGKTEAAIETLERGRGLIWSEMRGLRTSIDRLRMADLTLAEKFESVNRELEAVSMSGFPITRMDNDSDKVHGSGWIGQSGRMAMKQRKLLDERNSLIMQIRSFPGFENFMMSPPFDNLRSAAAHGPVIIVNHSQWRSDIIIVLHCTPPSVITTTRDFYNRARGLKDRLLGARQKGLDSAEYEGALTFVLATLYDLVGRPVIQRLQELNVPEQSRIWWCPTSVFCSLPLHAMGPIRSNGSFKLYFSDLYIPSYTPTLSALIQSRIPSSHSFERPSILLVAQPDEFMPGAWEEIVLIRRLETTVTTLASKRATPSAVMMRLRDHRFAHFSCHGILETGKPFDASFKLYQGERLTLLEIMRSQLPSAEFAFLSACHTAELTEESIADEGLHLSAALQYSGFRSVVGTMWAMADIDGQVLARNFYASVFLDAKWQGVPYYERTAEALREAVGVLRRKKNVTTERWVNFVHYGA